MLQNINKKTEQQKKYEIQLYYKGGYSSLDSSGVRGVG